MAKGFVKGSTTFICECCGHNTRFTGDQSYGSKLCPACWDLAGYENTERDGNMDEATAKHVAGLFNEIKARSETEYKKALKSFDLIAHYTKDEAPVETKKVASKGKYDYPAGLTQAQKKVFRAKARRSK